MLRPRQNGRRFADDTFKRIFLNENVRIWIKISLKFVPKGSISNIPALVQTMAWRRLGDKPLYEPMLACSPTHICGLNELTDNLVHKTMCPSFAVVKLRQSLAQPFQTYPGCKAFCRPDAKYPRSQPHGSHKHKRTTKVLGWNPADAILTFYMEAVCQLSVSLHNATG